MILISNFAAFRQLFVELSTSSFGDLCRVVDDDFRRSLRSVCSRKLAILKGWFECCEFLRILLWAICDWSRRVGIDATVVRNQNKPYCKYSDQFSSHLTSQRSFEGHV